MSHLSTDDDLATPGSIRSIYIHETFLGSACSTRPIVRHYGVPIRRKSRLSAQGRAVVYRLQFCFRIEFRGIDDDCKSDDVNSSANHPLCIVIDWHRIQVPGKISSS